MITNEFLIVTGTMAVIAWVVNLCIYKAYQDSIKGVK